MEGHFEIDLVTGKDTVSDDDITHRPSQLGNLLSSLIRRKGLVETSATASFDLAWKRVVGDELGKHSKFRKVRAGVLEVVVTNSVVLEQLRGFLHQETLNGMQARLPDSNITSIKYIRSR